MFYTPRLTSKVTLFGDTKSNKNSISVLIRIVDDISKPSEYLLTKIANYCDEVILVFSGTEEKYLDIAKRYKDSLKVRIFWVYTIGYSEPLLNLVVKEIKSDWIMFLTDRDLPSQSLIESLQRLVNSNADAFCIHRFVEKYENPEVPNWLLRFVQEGKIRSFTCNLSRKEATRYNEIIHGPIKIRGKRLKLEPVEFNIKRSYTLGDLDSKSDFISHWIEKESRYLFIEMFENRVSRADTLSLVLHRIGLYGNYARTLRKNAFLSKELTSFEYNLYSLLRNLRFGKLGLSFYDKLKVNTIKGTKKYRIFLFKISQYLKSLEENEQSILEFIGIKSVFVDNVGQSFSDLIRPEGSEINFVRHVLMAFRLLDIAYKDIDIEDVIDEVQKVLDNNIKLLQL